MQANDRRADPARTLAVGAIATLLAVTSAVEAQPARGTRGPRPIQWVLINFDATPSGERRPVEDGFSRLHEGVRALDNGIGAITLFLNAQFYMLPHGWRPRRGSPWEGRPETYARYIDPRTDDPRVIAYARDPEVIARRIETTRWMHARGVELAGHSTRHANGRGWSVARWTEEFDEYARYMRDVVGIPEPTGFRAPFLAWSEEMHQAEVNRGLRYDASPAVSADRCWPRRRPGTSLWVVGVPQIHVPRSERTMLSFDDAFRRAHLSDDDVFAAYAAEFDARYAGSRAPMVLATHGPFASAAIRLARRVCRQRDVRCGSYRELVDYLDANPSLEGRCRSVRLPSP